MDLKVLCTSYSIPPINMPIHISLFLFRIKIIWERDIMTNHLNKIFVVYWTILALMLTIALSILVKI